MRHHCHRSHHRGLTAVAVLALLMFGAPSMAAPVSWPVRFAPPQSTPTGANSAPVGLGVAHLFGQGSDLAVADAVRGLILMQNDGKGNFHEAMVLPAGNSATCVAAGSLVPGPVQSLAAANMLDTFVSVFFPLPTGGFRRQDLPMAASPQSVAMPDVKVAGQPALLVGLAGEHGEIVLMRLDATGWHTEDAADLPWIPMSIIPVHLRLGGTPEMVVTPASGHALAILRFTGLSTLGIHQILRAANPIVGAAAIAVPGGALLVGAGGPHITLWRRTDPNDFVPVAQLTSSEPLTGVALHDLNGDGIPDIIATSINHVLVWRGRADGSFESPQEVALASRGFAPVAADFDGDGRPDLAWNNSIWRSVSVLRNTTPAGVPGDADGDGVADVNDATLALRVALGLVSAPSDVRDRIDVWPVNPDGSWGDGRITVQDAVQILRWATGF